MQNLINAIRDRNVVLFVGAGVSMHLGLPSWQEIIDHIANDLDYDPEIFASLGSYLELAEHYIIEKGSIGSLRSWMDVNWHGKHIRIEDSEIHRIIVALDFPVIYTTNYDRWLETSFEYHGRKYVKIANVGDLIHVKNGYTQIVKLHGDFDDDSSIVLTESSYFDRLSLDGPLDIKLRSDILGKTVLFIGYSLSDVNMRYLLYRLHKLWSSTTYANARPQSYIFLNRPNPVQESILENRGIKPLFPDTKNVGVGLEEFLRVLAFEAFGKS